MSKSPSASGLLLAKTIASGALGQGHRLPLIGAPISGVALRILERSTHAPGPMFRPGIRFAGTQVSGGIVALGLGLSLHQMAEP